MEKQLVGVSYIESFLHYDKVKIRNKIENEIENKKQSYLKLSKSNV